MESKEIFKDIPGYEGKYQISNLGRIWSIGKQMYLKPKKSESGYLRIGLYAKNGKQKFESIHRLVALTFIPNPDGLPQVNHKDENKQNNCVENLEWISAKDNTNYGTRNARVSEKLSKPVCQYSLNGEWIATYKSMREAEQITGIPNGRICRCCKGELKKTGGYRWKYLDE